MELPPGVVPCHSRVLPRGTRQHFLVELRPGHHVPHGRLGPRLPPHLRRGGVRHHALQGARHLHATALSAEGGRRGTGRWGAST